MGIRSDRFMKKNDAPQLNGDVLDRKRLLRHSGTDRSAFSWMQRKSFLRRRQGCDRKDRGI